MAPQDVQISDRYDLIEPLGRGGMGVVWRAEDRLLRRTVALKEVELPAALPEPEREALRQRVLREARAAAGIAHAAAVTVYDVLQEEGKTYIVMEFVDAPTLGDTVERDGPLPPERAAAIGLDVIDVLRVAHARGIVHRDLKPSNIMVPVEGPAKLADFGIATVKGDPRITTTGLLLGSPAYMAPEQARGEEAGAEADMWALGATLYYALEGVAPFDKGQPIATLTAALHEEPRPMARSGPLEPVIMSLLAKDPARRPSASELRPELERVAAPREVDTRAAAIADEPVETMPGAPMPAETMSAAGVAVAVPPAGAAPARDERDELALAPQRDEREARRGRGWLVAAILGVLLLLGGLLYWNATREDDATTADVARDGETDESPGGRERGDRAAGGGATEGTDDGATPTETPTIAAAGWEPYEGILPEGYSIAYPEGWTVEEGTTNNPTSVRFRDVTSNSYLLLDWVSPPTSDDPVATAREYAENSFAPRHPGYREIELAPTTFKGFEAVDWEYTYPADGATLHAVNLQFITGDYGFALNFQTREQNWEASQPIFERFQASFQAPS